MELEGNSNSETSAVFLTQLRERHPGPLQVIWDNAPAPFGKLRNGEAVREYLRTPGLDLRLVNPRLHEGRLCRGTARTSTPKRRSVGLDERGGHRQSLPGQQGKGAEKSRQLPGRARQPERRGEAALPDGPEIKGRNTPARLPPRFPAPGKCTSHLGFGLAVMDMCQWREMLALSAKSICVAQPLNHWLTGISRSPHPGYDAEPRTQQLQAKSRSTPSPLYFPSLLRCRTNVTSFGGISAASPLINDN